MKPAWDKLMEEYLDSKDVLIADVDCTAAGKSLCTEIGVRGYPTIKHGSPANLEEYKGGRTEDDLLEFAKTLGPSCGPDHMDLCSSEKKAKIEELQKMAPEAREKRIKEDTKKLEDIESTFKSEVDKLQSQYKELETKKGADLEAIKKAGLGLLKAVHNAEKAKGGKSEL